MHPLQPPSGNSGSYFSKHPRTFEDFRYVYPVVSRRAGGISLGVNLNPDKICNFHCIYCQVDRHGASHPPSDNVKAGSDGSSLAAKEPTEGSSASFERGGQKFIEVDRLVAELESVLELWRSGQLFTIPPFCHLPSELRRLNDIAFSGDGEPTTYRNFAEIVAACAEVPRRHGLADLKLVLITNASMFHEPHVQRGLALLDQAGGEIWAKLDAGTEAYFRQVARTAVPFERILQNIQEAAQDRPLVIQSLFMRIAGQGPSVEEQTAYCERLQEILAQGGQIKLVQIYTIARAPSEPIVTALPPEELDALAERVRKTTGLPVAVFYAPQGGESVSTSVGRVKAPEG